MGITHAFVSAKTDGGDATLVQPSDWNDEHVGAVGLEEIACSAQAALQADAATTNYENSGLVGQDTGSFAGHNLMRFSLTGVTAPKLALLQFVILNNNNCLGNAEGVNAFLHVYRMLRTDINYAQVTHNIYKTSNNWGTAGATNATDRTTSGRSHMGPFVGTHAISVMTGSTVDRRTIDITEIVRAAVDASQTDLDIMLTASATSGQNKLTIASVTDGTTALRPRLLWTAADVGGTTALDDLTDVDAASPSDGDVLTFDTGSGDWVNAAPAGGGGDSPKRVQAVKSGGNTQNPAITIAAAASGNLLIVAWDGSGRTITSITCTNVTFTQMATHNNSGTHSAIWVGVVAGGSSGTTLTINTASSAFYSAHIMEIADPGVTPTVGAAPTATFNSGTDQVMFNDSHGLTAGRLYAVTLGPVNSSATGTAHIPTGGAVSGQPLCGCWLGVGFVPPGETLDIIASSFSGGGTGAALLTEII